MFVGMLACPSVSLSASNQCTHSSHARIVRKVGQRIVLFQQRAFYMRVLTAFCPTTRLFLARIKEQAIHQCFQQTHSQPDSQTVEFLCT